MSLFLPCLLVSRCSSGREWQQNSLLVTRNGRRVHGGSELNLMSVWKGNEGEEITNWHLVLVKRSGEKSLCH